VLVDNEFGVLSRIIGLFSGRGYNIESLTVAEVEHTKQLSRITIATSGTEMVIEQIKSCSRKWCRCIGCTTLPSKARMSSRELALIKVVGDEESRVEALKVAETFSAPASSIRRRPRSCSNHGGESKETG